MQKTKLAFLALTVLVANQAAATEWEVVKNLPKNTNVVFSIDKDSLVYIGEARSFWVRGTRPDVKDDSRRMLWHLTVKCEKRLITINETIDYSQKDSLGLPIAKKNPPFVGDDRVEPGSIDEAIFDAACTHKRWLFF
jgi:hypothetical protein